MSVPASYFSSLLPMLQSAYGLQQANASQSPQQVLSPALQNVGASQMPQWMQPQNIYGTAAQPNASPLSNAGVTSASPWAALMSNPQLLGAIGKMVGAQQAQSMKMAPPPPAPMFNGRQFTPQFS